MSHHKVVCDACGGRAGAVVKSFRLDPKTWTEHFRLLCPECRRKLRYTPVSHDRPYVDMNAQHLL